MPNGLAQGIVSTRWEAIEVKRNTLQSSKTSPPVKSDAHGLPPEGLPPLRGGARHRQESSPQLPRSYVWPSCGRQVSALRAAVSVATAIPKSLMSYPDLTNNSKKNLELFLQGSGTWHSAVGTCRNEGMTLQAEPWLAAAWAKRSFQDFRNVSSKQTALPPTLHAAPMQSWLSAAPLEKEGLKW